MKYLIAASLLTILSATSFADSKLDSDERRLGETQTECPWMQEMTKRVNTKSHLLDSKEKKARPAKGQFVAPV